MGSLDIVYWLLLEVPLGLAPCSDVFVPVTVTYTDGQGRKVV
jgi:hypothetical protein